MTSILVSFAISLAVNAVFFVVAAARKTDVVTDLSYSLSFAALAIGLPLLGGAYSAGQLVAAGLVLAWAIRLGIYLFGRILRVKVDHRFDEMRDRPLVFARFWILQALTVAIVMLPASYLLSRKHAPALGAWAIAGGAVWLAGLAVEWLGDAQKSAAKKASERFVASGLWRFSRHPNYFGEMLVWWGIFVFAIPFLHGLAFLTAIGPAFITLLLLFVSGIPPLEKSAEARFGEDPEYREYRRRTSILVPLPRRRESPGDYSRISETASAPWPACSAATGEISSMKSGGKPSSRSSLAANSFGRGEVVPVYDAVGAQRRLGVDARGHLDDLGDVLADAQRLAVEHRVRPPRRPR